MSTELDRLTRKLRRAQNQQSRAARLSVMLGKARASNLVLRRRVKLLRKTLAERDTALGLATGILQRIGN